MNYASDLADVRSPYHREASRLALELADPAHAYIVDGVIRWRSNNSVPPADCVALALHIGQPVDVAACDRARDTETRAFILAYRKRQAERTPEQVAEQRAEARVAMGPGCDMVNLFTGETFKT